MKEILFLIILQLTEIRRCYHLTWTLAKYVKPFLKNLNLHLTRENKDLLSILWEQSEQFYFIRFFQENNKDLRNTRKWIRKIISLNNCIHIITTAITDDKVTITNPSEIADALNNYFTKVAKGFQFFIRFSNKKYCNSLPSLNMKSFFGTPVDGTKVFNIISSLSRTRILEFLNKDMSDQLAFLFENSFSSRVFPSFLEASKIISI